MASKIRDAFYRGLSPDVLLGQARPFADQFVRGDPGFCDPEQAVWSYEARFPIARLDTPVAEWQAFMREEIHNWKVDAGQPTRFSDMLHRPISNAAILFERDAKVYVWDGRHRVGACALTGRKSVPAIVGRPNLSVELEYRANAAVQASAYLAALTKLNKHNQP